MLSDATPPARNHQHVNRNRFLPLSGLIAVLFCLTLFNACTPANSATWGGSSTSSSHSDPSLVVSGNLPVAQVGVTYKQILTVSGGKAPYVFSLSWGSLPPGMTLSPSTGIISGTPPTTGTFGFGVHVVDSSDLGGASAFSMTVMAPAIVTVTPATDSIPSASTLQLSALVTNASQAVTWSASAGTISSNGLYKAPAVTATTTVTVTATSTAETSASGTATLTIVPPAIAPPVTVTVTPATDTVTSAATVQFSALVTNTSNVAVTWSTSAGTISSTGLYTAPTVSANTSATVTATSVGQTTASGTASLTITPPPPPPLVITTSLLPGATSGTAYSTPLAATGGTAPYTWSLTTGSLPTGLTVPSRGSLSGTPSQTGTFSFTVQVADSGSPKQTASQALTLTVVSPTPLGHAPAAAFLGFSESDTNGGGWPNQTYGMQRFWDSPPDQWPDLNTAPGVFTFSSLDNDLALAYSKGTMLAMYTLARTPPWASSVPTDSSCNYTTGMGGGLGECDAPSDLNADGSGTNATWKAWITAIANHANDPTYLQTHAHIKYWEIWNEPDTKAFWAGSIAQLARLTEDANCIITGRGVIHENGNGTATPCTATAIDPTAQIVMASAHAKTVALAYGQNELYCNNTSAMKAYQFPCPNPATAIATAVDIINFHMKPGNEVGGTYCGLNGTSACTVEAAMQWYVSNIQGILQPAEQAKPLWDGEAQYSSSGFTGTYADPDLAASFMPRFYLVNWTLNISGMAWYAASGMAEPLSAGTSYQQVYDWLSNATLTTPCAATGTVWTCGITLSGKNYQIMWDTSQTCASGTCTTGNQTVSSEWTQYQDMTTASTPTPITGDAVPVGIKPVVLSN